MVVVKETDGNEWLGKVLNRDVKKKADNPHKYLVQDKFGSGYRVDFQDDDWRWHQAQEEVLLVMLPRCWTANNYDARSPTVREEVQTPTTAGSPACTRSLRRGM